MQFYGENCVARDLRSFWREKVFVLCSWKRNWLRWWSLNGICIILKENWVSGALRIFIQSKSGSFRCFPGKRSIQGSKILFGLEKTTQMPKRELKSLLKSIFSERHRQKKAQKTEFSSFQANSKLPSKMNSIQTIKFPLTRYFKHKISQFMRKQQKNQNGQFAAHSSFPQPPKRKKW